MTIPYLSHWPLIIALEAAILTARTLGTPSATAASLARRQCVHVCCELVGVAGMIGTGKRMATALLFLGTLRLLAELLSPAQNTNPELDNIDCESDDKIGRSNIEVESQPPASEKSVTIQSPREKFEQAHALLEKQLRSEEQASLIQQSTRINGETCGSTQSEVTEAPAPAKPLLRARQDSISSLDQATNMQLNFSDRARAQAGQLSKVGIHEKFPQLPGPELDICSGPQLHLRYVEKATQSPHQDQSLSTSLLQASRGSKCPDLCRKDEYSAAIYEYSCSEASRIYAGSMETLRLSGRPPETSGLLHIPSQESLEHYGFFSWDPAIPPAPVNSPISYAAIEQDCTDSRRTCFKRQHLPHRMTHPADKLHSSKLAGTTQIAAQKQYSSLQSMSRKPLPKRPTWHGFSQVGSNIFEFAPLHRSSIIREGAGKHPTRKRVYSSLRAQQSMIQRGSLPGPRQQQPLTTRSIDQYCDTSQSHKRSRRDHFSHRSQMTKTIADHVCLQSGESRFARTASPPNAEAQTNDTFEGSARTTGLVSPTCPPAQTYPVEQEATRQVENDLQHQNPFQKVTFKNYAPEDVYKARDCSTALLESSKASSKSHSSSDASIPGENYSQTMPSGRARANQDIHLSAQCETAVGNDAYATTPSQPNSKDQDASTYIEQPTSLATEAHDIPCPDYRGVMARLAADLETMTPRTSMASYTANIVLGCDRHQNIWSQQAKRNLRQETEQQSEFRIT